MKTSTIVTVVIVLAVIVGAVVYIGLDKSDSAKVSVSPTASSPAANDDWTTYTNTAYGYEIIVPGDWRLGDSPNSSTPDPTSKRVAFDGGPADAAIRFQVDVVTPARPCDSDQTCIEQNRVSFSSDQQSAGLVRLYEAPFSYSEVIKRPLSGDWLYQVYYAYRNGKVYQVVAYAKEKDFPAYDTIVSRMFSEFKFTK